LSSDPLRNEINVTPLADVMLVLLIIFMVVTPMITTGVDVTTPYAEHPVEHPDTARVLVLSLREDGSLHLNHDRIAPEELFGRLSAIMESRSDKVLYVKAAETLDYGDVLGWMDVCRRAGFAEVALVTREKKSGGR
jgi:biopolymer transport protein ExbD